MSEQPATYALRDLASIPDDHDETFTVGQIIFVDNPLIMPAPEIGTKVKVWYECVVAGEDAVARFKEHSRATITEVTGRE